MYFKNVKLDLKPTYHIYVKNILITGKNVEKDDKDNILEVMYNHYFIKPAAESSEILLDGIRKGDFDVDGYPLKGVALFDYVNSFNNPDLGGFVYTYPNRIHENPVNQFEIVLNRLLNYVGTNRAVMNIYNGQLDGTEKDIPCLNWIQAIVRDSKLTLHCMFRSNDVYGAFYSNMLFLNYLGLRLVEEYNDKINKTDANIVFDGIDYNCTSGHIYESDIRSAKKLIENSLIGGTVNSSR